MDGEVVQAGRGGKFKIRSGVTTIWELADVYEVVHGTQVDVVDQ